MTVEYPIIAMDDFARRFTQRGPSLMWLLGAGASAAAGVPTANDLTWHFKQQLYASQRRVSLENVADLSNPVVRSRLQEHIDSLGTLPRAGDMAEYAELFEAAYSSETDRRSLLDAKLSGAGPSYGHIALATLMRGNRVRIVWTTNFDSLVADSCAVVFGSTSRLTSVDLEAPDQLDDLVTVERWPIEIKLHGDFRSRRLKNTSDELRHQDAKLRSGLVRLGARFGLIVVGYSGRDGSVMDSLFEAVKNPGAFPGGVFWLHRASDELQPVVKEFLQAAARDGVDGGLVEIDSFDEVLRDLMRLLPDLSADELRAFAEERRRWTPAPRSLGKGGWPVVRLNALPVVTWPNTCRRIQSDIGGWKEVREAFNSAAADVPFARVRAGVLAFGPDQELRRVLTPHGISEFDLYDIQAGKLRRDGSGERSLVTEALVRAIERAHGLQIVSRRSGAWLLAPQDPEDPKWRALSSLVGPIDGTLPNLPEVRWREGVSVHLDWAADQLWLLFDGLTVFDDLPVEARRVAGDFARERSVQRYNRELNRLLDFWSGLLGSGVDITALEIEEGVNATFRVGTSTAFSRRGTQ